MTRTRGRRVDTRTIQTWPGGASYEYRGDPHGPENQRSLRAGHYEARKRCAAHCVRYTSVDLRDESAELYATWAAYSVNGVEARAERFPKIGAYLCPPEGRYNVRYDDPICAACAGAGYIDNPVKNTWRKGTAAEWRTIRIALRAERYQEVEILCCDSSLVDDLIRACGEGLNDGEGRRSDLADAFGIDAIRNIYADPSDWDADRCREYAEDEGIELPELPDLHDGCKHCDRAIRLDRSGPAWLDCETDGDVCAANDGGAHHPEKDGDTAVTDSLMEDWLTEAREVCSDHAQDNPAEPYEWWRVSQWLCDRLHEIGRVTIDNNYGCWWGRTCSGQGLIMDGVLQEIAAAAEEDK